MRRRSLVLRRFLVPFLVLGALCTLAAAPASAQRYVIGSSGGGDPFFPQAGNGGYDARRYSLDLNYDQGQNLLAGRVAMAARATENLSRFNLDLRDFYDVTSVTVNGHRASFTHEGQELSIDPRPKLKEGRRFVVVV